MTESKWIPCLLQFYIIHNVLFALNTAYKVPVCVVYIPVHRLHNKDDSTKSSKYSLFDTCTSCEEPMSWVSGDNV
jgi:hypothetical protein